MLMFPKPTKRPKKTPKPLKRSRKPIARKSKFHAQTNAFKDYGSKRRSEEIQSFAKQCRRLHLANPTPAEQAFAELLRELGINYDRERIFYYAQGSKFIIVDIFLREFNIAIELDGGQHKSQAGYDRGRDKWLETQGIRTIRFTNSQILKQKEWVKEKVIGILDEK